MLISDQEYQQLVQLIHKELGIALGEEKHSLLVNRLKPLIVKRGFNSFREYYQHLKADSSGKALISLANRITTNYSFFFREEGHFNFLIREALPRRVKQSASDPNIRFWSAGCSAGEEAYSLSIILQSFFELPFNQKQNILATDIDTKMLNKAYQGVYTENDLKDVPTLKLKQYFTSVQPGVWQIKPESREMIHFSRFNLVQSNFNFKKKFFTIFCRNVMIYFDNKTINNLIEKFYEVTENNGYLFIGQSESLDKNNCPYHYVAPSIYQKRE